MLLASGWGPHGNSGVGISNHLESPRLQPLNPFRNGLLAELKRETIGALRERLEITEQQIRYALELLGEAGVPRELLAIKLVAIAVQMKHLKKDDIGARMPGDNAEIAALRSKAKAAFENNDYNTAGNLLKKVQEKQNQAKSKLAVSELQTSAQLGRLALARLQYREAANFFAGRQASFRKQMNMMPNA